jgi:hypothetical protein
MEMKVKYPDENPPDTIHSIAKALNFVGAFDAIK